MTALMVMRGGGIGSRPFSPFPLRRHSLVRGICFPYPWTVHADCKQCKEAEGLRRRKSGNKKKKARAEGDAELGSVLDVLRSGGLLSVP